MISPTITPIMKTGCGILKKVLFTWLVFSDLVNTKAVWYIYYWKRKVHDVWIYSEKNKKTEQSDFECKDLKVLSTK